MLKLPSLTGLPTSVQLVVAVGILLMLASFGVAKLVQAAAMHRAAGVARAPSVREHARADPLSPEPRRRWRWLAWLTGRGKHDSRR
jgi:hypothetical protein